MLSGGSIIRLAARPILVRPQVVPWRPQSTLIPRQNPFKTIKLPRFAWATKVLDDVPPAPKYLGLSGLLPFIGTTLGSIVHPESVFLLQEIQAGYGAVILSFMGAVHWGTAMTNLTPRAQTQLSPVPNGIRYALSTAPSLIAFFALPSVLGGGDWDVSGYAQLAGFNALLVADVLSAKMSLVPRWYTPLRIVLTLTVSGCIGLTLWIKGRRRSRINATSEKAK